MLPYYFPVEVLEVAAVDLAAVVAPGALVVLVVAVLEVVEAVVAGSFFYRTIALEPAIAI